MSEGGNQHIVQCQDCGGIAPAHSGPNGTIQVPNDLSLGGCDTHEFVALNGKITDSNEGSVILDTIFDLLTEQRRRYVLYYLDSQDRPVPIEEITEQIARWESEGSPETIPAQTSDQIEITLAHRHLPKLDSAHCIEYDSDTQSLYLRGPSPAFKAILTIAKLVEKPSESS